MVTIRDISEKAGVSTATVSKVVNGQSGVKEETRRLVLDVAKQLNYRPNLNARHLKKGASHTLGVITEDLTVFNAAGIVDGIGVCCEDRKYHYILGNLRFNQRFGSDPYYMQQRAELVSDMIYDMLSKQVDGIIYIGCHSHELDHAQLMKDTRFVCAYCYSSDPEIPSIIYDDRSAAYAVAELLIEKGARKIGMIAGAKQSGHTANRTIGFQEALFDHGIPYNPHLTRYGDWDRNLGYRHAGALISGGVDAIFAQNDLMALGVIDYCNEKGVEVGKDLLLAGFDNRELAAVCRPTLTTVAPPLFEIGQTAARLLIDMLENDTSPEEHIITLGCNIIPGESTGK